MILRQDGAGHRALRGPSAMLAGAVFVIVSSGCGADSTGTSKSSGGPDGGGQANAGGGPASSAGHMGATGGTGVAASGGADGSSGGATPLGGAGGAPNGGSSHDGGGAAGPADGGPDAASTGGTGGDPSASVVSGTRLKAKFVTSADGAKSYRRGILYDSQLKVDCAYTTAADGKTRCLPAAPFAVSGPIMYADANCTELVIWLTPGPVGCPFIPPYAFTGQTVGHCTQQFQEQYYPIEGTIIDNAGHFQKNGTACVGVGVSYPGSVAVKLGPEAMASTFVEGTPAVAQ